jgi:hypothetical protein
MEADCDFRTIVRMHDPVPQTGQFNYHAVPGNLVSLGVFRVRVFLLFHVTQFAPFT